MFKRECSQIKNQQSKLLVLKSRNKIITEQKSKIMKHFHTNANFNFPIVTGTFLGKTIPTSADYAADYYIHYLRYLYFMCCMNAEGLYPVEISIEQMLDGWEKNKNKPKINKILIGEAPPPVAINYFYNPSSPWSRTGNPGKGGNYTRSIKNALFPGMAFPTKIDFLIACARNGFLLLDLFPYAMPFGGGIRSTRRYTDACISAFGGAAAYPLNIISILDNLKNCIKSDFSIAFAQISFGNTILSDLTCVSNFNAWLSANGKSINPAGPIDILRPIAIPNVSPFLRVCGKRGSFVPIPALLNDAGIA